MDKKNVVYALGIVALSSGIAFALPTAEPGDGVVGSAHDMTTYTDNGAVITETENRVCAFCHTPHHAITEGNDYLPLWSHTLATTSGYSAYASSTIDSTISGEMMQGPSKLCMSCHDGAVAVDTHYGTVGTNFLTSDEWGEAAIAKIATLENDHPIGFNYNAVANGPDTGDPAITLVRSDGKDNWIRSSEAFYKGSSALKIKDRLYENAGGEFIMTCATCHDVHNKKNKADAGAVKNYFLLAPNADSQLCLTCHIK